MNKVSVLLQLDIFTTTIELYIYIFWISLTYELVGCVGKLNTSHNYSMVNCHICFLMFLLTSYLTESLWRRCQPRRLSQGWRRKWREGEDKGTARGGAHPQSEGSPGAGNQCHWPSLRAAGHSHSRLRLRGRGNCIPDGPTSGGKGTWRNVLSIVPS